MIVSTTDKWSKHAEEALEDQTIPVTRLQFKDLADSPIDWSKFSLANVKDIRLKPKKKSANTRPRLSATSLQDLRKSTGANSSWPAAPARPLPHCT